MLIHQVFSPPNQRWFLIFPKFGRGTRGEELTNFNIYKNANEEFFFVISRKIQCTRIPVEKFGFLVEKYTSASNWHLGFI